MRLATRVDSPNDLTAADRDVLFQLMDRYYAGVSRASFEHDLSEKSWVIRMFEPSTGVVRGFSTQMVLDAHLADRPVRALFSGDTIVDRRCWGSTALPIAWGKLALSLLERDPGADWYWMLICKGFRTYRFLPVFFQQFFPRHDAAWPEDLRLLRDTLAQAKFGDSYDLRTGVVCSPHGGYSLPAEEMDGPTGRADPHVAFFHQQNPGFRRGDELCCIAPISRENFTSAGQRLMATPEFLRPLDWTIPTSEKSANSA